MKLFKRIIALVVVCLFMSGCFPGTTYSKCGSGQDNPIENHIKSKKCLGTKRSKAMFAKQHDRKKEIRVVVTAYYRPSPDQKIFSRGTYKKEVKMNGAGELTSTGTVPEVGTIAADPDFLPPGTKLIVPGYESVSKEAVVEDTGRKIKGPKIDLFMGVGDPGRELAMAWGKREMIVTISSEAIW